MLVALILPTSALGAPAPVGQSGDADSSFDTPKPRATPRPKRTPKPKKTPKKPRKTPRPTAAPTLKLGAVPALLPPESDSLVIGYEDPAILGHAPFRIAELRGYFADAGLTDVTIVQTADALGDLRNGDLHFAVVPSRAAFDSYVDDPTIQAVAGFRNYQRQKGRYGGDLVLANSGMVAHQPATTIAFLHAYIRALQDLSKKKTADRAFAGLQESDLAIDPAVARRWAKAQAVYGPFDGGFGARDDAQGVGELEDWLGDRVGDDVDVLDDFVAAHTLNIAQALLELVPNPDAGLVGPPSIPEVSVALSPSDSSSPIAVADSAGYFAEAGFDSVAVMDVEQPILGLLNGELDFAVVDAADAAEWVDQGLAVAIIAGHANYAADGSYSGNALVAPLTLLADDRTTATAFLIAYVQGLRDMAADSDASPFAPHDGGLGDRDDEGGLGELRTHLGDAGGSEPDLDALVDATAVEFAQAWLGLPANPTDAPPLPVAVEVLETTEEAA